MMSLISKKVILLLSLLLMVQMVKCSYPKCPRYCKCDVYRQLNRAECSDRRLISAEVEVPIVVEILDLSYNDITTIETESFQSYKQLVSLNLSHNAIYTLELESISQLQRIQEIDLSYNRLRYLDDFTFERNRKLHKLNLEGNRFKAIAVKPFFKSPSLKQLNLRNCQIAFINRRLFSQLPNLEELNLAENLLNNFLPQDFDGLFKLRVLNLSQNPMRCDKSLKNKLRQLQDKGIKVTMPECKSSQKTHAMVGRKYPKKKAMPTQLPQPEDNKASNQWNWSENINKFLLIAACTSTVAIIKLTFGFLERKRKKKERHSDVQLTTDREPLAICPRPLENPRQQLPAQNSIESDSDDDIITGVVGIEDILDNVLDIVDECT